MLVMVFSGVILIKFYLKNPYNNKLHRTGFDSWQGTRYAERRYRFN